MRPILIAEACQNHNGRRDILQRIVHSAAEAGADYVKIQAARSRDLTFRERFETGTRDANGRVTSIHRPYQAEFERLSRLDLSLDDEQWFVDECRRAGVASMTTVFTRSAAREVKDMGYEAAKIASYDCRSVPLLQDVSTWWSDIVISTGATFDAEIEDAARALRGAHSTFLHCVTIYPTPLESLHLARMAWLRRFTPRVGFSDHTLVARDGNRGSMIALALGATCIERHYTVLDADATKDGPVSIKAAQLADLRAFADRPRIERMAIVRREIPDWERAIGVASRELSATELLNRDYYAGRFASKIGELTIYNWQDVDIDALWSAAGSGTPTVTE